MPDTVAALVYHLSAGHLVVKRQEAAKGLVQPFLEHLFHFLCLLARYMHSSLMKVSVLLLEVVPNTETA